MRRAFSDHLEKIAGLNEKVIFITGDLGYNAFENLQSTMGERFINAGVAEQNMVGFAAGLAHQGFHVFCYSIAPFITYRCLEQIRLDICFHELPVCIVANGAGYGYGIMGATHHCLEDIACLSSMPSMKVYTPSFKEDVSASIDSFLQNPSPSYLRLGLGKNKPDIASDSDGLLEFLKKDPLITIVALGHSINNVLEANLSTPHSADIFAINSIPFDLAPILVSLEQTRKLLVVEEHVQRGGLSELLSQKILENNIQLKKFKSLHALGYPGKVYGDQAFHQKQSGLDAENITRVINSLS